MISIKIGRENRVAYAALQNLTLHQVLDHFTREPIRVLAPGQKVQLGIFRHFVGLIHASEILDLAGERAPIQALGIARECAGCSRPGLVW